MSKLIHIRENGELVEDYRGTHVLLSIEDYKKLIIIIERLCQIPREHGYGLDIYYPPKEK